jgi:polyhydroxyalkanoate synthesis regulator phasin
MKQKNTPQPISRDDLQEVLEPYATKLDVQNVEIQLQQLINETKQMENRLNKRLTDVVDQLTVAIAGKIQNHEKRITKLEKSTFS